MTSILLALALAIPTTHAARDKPARGTASAAELPPAEMPAAEPEEGSLWDYIEALEGTVPADESAVEQSEEREAEQVEAAAFIQKEAKKAPPTAATVTPSEMTRITGNAAAAAAFYKDPVATLSDDPLHLALIDPSEFDIPVVVNDDVIRWMNYFTGRGRKYYERWLARSTRYRPMMYAKLDAAGLPRDLVYLSMIESGYATHAYSSAAAVGLWQFISSTGKEHDLRIDWWVDERRDPELATEAAARFLGRLHKRYGDWYLAWGAYNGGPGRMDRAVRKHGTKDFWTLVRKDALPGETDNYVPKLLAAAIIGKHPERYGFTGIEYQDALEYDTVEVGPSISVDVLAKCAGLTQEELQTLNPHLRRWATPPSPTGQMLRVPKDKGKKFVAALAKVPAEERLTFVRHKVQKGETLGTIARKYSVSVSALQSTNRIRNANRIYVGMELVVPKDGGALPPAASVALASSSGKSAAKPAASTRITHTVRKGESLSRIADKYGASQSEVMRWNGITNANRIYAGQSLKLYVKASTVRHYTVQRGDTLSTIAQRNGCSITQLKSWNKISGSTIYPGQRLKVAG